VGYAIPFDTTRFVDASIKEVNKTIFEAGAARAGGGVPVPADLARDASSR
jgi:hypothetical protein